MSNDPKADLIDAILSLDSYNRGYGSGISQLGSTTQIGNWTILPDSENRPSIVGGQAAGFYAIAYQNNTTQEIVISYRGTDYLGLSSSSPYGGNDAYYGYGLALGNTQNQTNFVSSLSSVLGTTQADLAAKFYTSVTGQSDAQKATNVTLVGHSLGGGLAGYIAATTGTKSIVFNDLPYDVSAVNRANELGVTYNSSNVSTYSTVGELLENARNGDYQNWLGSALTGFLPSSLTGVQGVALSIATAALEAQRAGNNSKLDTNSTDSLSLLQKHSQSMLTLLLWNKGFGNQDWGTAAKEVWGAFFDDSVAAAISQTNDNKGRYSRAEVMEAAIAYSALGDAGGSAGEGKLVFGNTAINALFDDAGDLGKVLADSNVPDVYGTLLDTGTVTKSFKQILADMVVQYAGALALNHVTEARGGTLASGADARKGVLDSSGNTLTLDVSDTLWKDGLKDPTTGAAPNRLNPIEFQDFLKTWLAQTDTIKLGDLPALASAIWGANTAAIFNRFHIATSNAGGDVLLAEPTSYTPYVRTGNNTSVDTFIGTNANENICVRRAA